MMLRTPRLCLRPLALSDAAALLPIFQDAETMRYWAYGPVPDVAAMEAKIASNLNGGGPPNTFALARSEAGPAQGWVVLYDVKDGNAGAGYLVAPALRGQGLVAEAMRELMRYAFDARDLHRLYLDIDPENSPSIRLAQRLGFRWEGHFKQSFFRDGQYFDSVFYAMLAQEWRALKGSA